MVQKVLQKKYIIGWCCLFVKKKKKFVMINIFKVKECFYKDLKKILNMFLFCKIFKIYVVVNNIDILNEKKFLNDFYVRIIFISCISQYMYLLVSEFEFQNIL